MKAVRWTSGEQPGLELHDEPTPTPGSVPEWGVATGHNGGREAH